MDPDAFSRQPGTQKMLESFDGLWASPGSPYKSLDGMLKGIEFARKRDWPFLGTCGGFQYAFIECARNVLGLKDADTAENNSGIEKHHHLSGRLRGSRPQRKCTQAFRSGSRNSPSSRLVSAIVLREGHER